MIVNMSTCGRTFKEKVYFSMVDKDYKISQNLNIYYPKFYVLLDNQLFEISRQNYTWVYMQL